MVMIGVWILGYRYFSPQLTLFNLKYLYISNILITFANVNKEQLKH